MAAGYIDTLWSVGLLIGSVIENPACATQAQKEAMQAMFEGKFSAMLSGNVEIATGKAGILLSSYIRSPMARPAQVLDLYRQLRNNQDALLARVYGLMDAATTAAEFRTPYDPIMASFDGSIGGIVATLTMAEGDLIPLLSRQMALMAGRQKEARDAIFTSATNRLLSMAAIYGKGAMIGVGTDALTVIADPGPVEMLYRTWIGVLRAVANAAVAGEEANEPAQEAFGSLLVVTSHINDLISRVYAMDSPDGLMAARAVLVHLPMQEISSFTAGQQALLFRALMNQFQLVRDRAIAVSGRVGLSAEEVDGLIGTLGVLMSVPDRLFFQDQPVGLDEWTAIYTEIGRCVAGTADRLAQIDGFDLEYFERLANLTFSFSDLAARILARPFADVSVDEFRPIANGAVGAVMPAMIRLRAMVDAAPQGERREAMTRAMGSPERGLEYLLGYVRDRMNAPAPAPELDPESLTVAQILANAPQGETAQDSLEARVRQILRNTVVQSMGGSLQALLTVRRIENTFQRFWQVVRSTVNEIERGGFVITDEFVRVMEEDRQWQVTRRVQWLNSFDQRYGVLLDRLRAHLLLHPPSPLRTNPYREALNFLETERSYVVLTRNDFRSMTGRHWAEAGVERARMMVRAFTDPHFYATQLNYYRVVIAPTLERAALERIRGLAFSAQAWEDLMPDSPLPSWNLELPER